MFQQLTNYNQINARINQHGRGSSGEPQWQYPAPWMQPGIFDGPVVTHSTIEFLPQQIPVHTSLPYPYREVNRVFEPSSPYSFGSAGYPLMPHHGHRF